MLTQSLFLQIFSMHLMTILSVVAFGSSNNEVPIIGILSQEAKPIKDYLPDNANYSSFISASYVKFVEAAGARAVPIMINQNEDYYKNIVKNTNGLLLPGGAAAFDAKNGYYDAATTLYKIASDINGKGDYYPIIGICLGMEFLAVVGANGNSPLTSCSGEAIALNVTFKPDFRSSKLFQSVDTSTIESLEKKSVTYNNHKYCVTPKSFVLFGLANKWDILSTSLDKNGIEFISILENRDYPFYGVQFHPEKNIFGHELGTDIPHTEAGIKASQYFLNFFVFESRRNDHKFPTWEEEHKSLIYNYQPVFVNRQNSLFEQLYLFV